MEGGEELSHSIPQICIARLQTSIWAARPKELAGANSTQSLASQFGR